MKNTLNALLTKSGGRTSAITPELLTGYLNHPKAEHKRLDRVLELTQKIRAADSAGDANVFVNQLRDVLAGFKAAMIAQWFFAADGWRVEFNWQPRGGTAIKIGDDYVDEGRAIFAVLRLQAEQHEDRLRRCERCQRWYFSKFPTRDRYCSHGCQQIAFRATPEFKERRRQRMRVYMAKKRKEAKAELLRLQRAVARLRSTKKPQRRKAK